jgi:hypothetical protein
MTGHMFLEIVGGTTLFLLASVVVYLIYMSLWWGIEGRIKYRALILSYAAQEKNLEELTTNYAAAFERVTKLEELLVYANNQNKLQDAEVRQENAAYREKERKDTLIEVVRIAEKHGWNGVENSKVLVTFLDQELGDLSKLRGLRDLAKTSRTDSSAPNLSLKPREDS